MVDIGDAGRHSNGGVQSNSAFGRAIEDNSLSFPPSGPLPGMPSSQVPYVIVGDEAFPLKQHIIRPYPGRNLPESQAVYNYRLSRACRVVENSFGILASMWRIFRRSIIATPDHAIAYTKAAIALHNYLRVTESSVYCPPGFVDTEISDAYVVSGRWREDSMAQGLEQVCSFGSNFHSQTAASIRDASKNYFSLPPGEVSWQYQHVRRTN